MEGVDDGENEKGDEVEIWMEKGEGTVNDEGGERGERGWGMEVSECVFP